VERIARPWNGWMVYITYLHRLMVWCAIQWDKIPVDPGSTNRPRNWPPLGAAFVLVKAAPLGMKITP
jgi:hypothetical protein